MKVKPVKRRKQPEYPTHDYLKEHPELLRLVPERWRHKRSVLAILSAAAFLITLAQNQGLTQGKAGSGGSRIAPIFVHSEGRGAFGCIVVNPPVFLTEDEARAVIQEEAKKAGLHFLPDGFTIKDVDLPATDESLSVPSASLGNRRQKSTIPTQRGDLLLDGYESKRNIGYEFISADDFKAWKDRRVFGGSSVSSYDFLHTAGTLRVGLAAKVSTPWTGIFFEPAAHPALAMTAADTLTEAARNRYWTARRNVGRQVGEEQLRLQVRDFIRWLKSQGVI